MQGESPVYILPYTPMDNTQGFDSIRSQSLGLKFKWLIRVRGRVGWRVDDC